MVWKTGVRVGEGGGMDEKGRKWKDGGEGKDTGVH